MEKLRLHVLVFISLLAFKIRYSCSQLVVNVKTNSGKITKQQILADPEKDIVTIDFSFADGTGTTALIDFPKVNVLLQYAIYKYLLHTFHAFI